MGRPRILFMGTPEFAAKALEACLKLGDVVAAVTQPDKAKGRGQALALSEVKALAQASGVPVLQPAKIRGTDFAAQARALGADVSVVAAYGKILPKDVLDAPRLGSINVHASLLPRWRGAAPIQRALLAGDAVSGVTLMKMDEGMDTGPILEMREVPIRPEETGASLHDALAALGASMLLELLPRFLAGTLPARPQPSEGVTLAPMLKKEEGELDFALPSLALERRVRAFNPWPGTFTRLQGALLKVHRVELGQRAGGPGEVVGVDGALEVACGEGALRLLEVQPEGRRRMRASEFLAGHPLAPGSRPFARG
jgi:methionyl-tRNA formyltransferase